MTNYIILDKADMHALCDDKPVWLIIDGKAYKLLTGEGFEKERNPQNKAEKREDRK